MKYDTKVAVVTFSVFLILVVISVGLIVGLTRLSTTASTTSPTPTPPYVTPIPPDLQKVRLKNLNNLSLCYQFDNLQPRLGVPESCTGFWIQNRTQGQESLTYNGGNYQTCIMAPAAQASGNSVMGTVGSGCTGITLDSAGVVTATGLSPNLCINSIGGTTLVWGNCVSPFQFQVQTLTS